jgi:2'-5' RNA ligase
MKVNRQKVPEELAMSECVRAFLAFDINNEEVKKKLIDVQQLLARTNADMKLVEPENIHITIRFLGDITLNMVDKIYEEMKKIQFKPFIIKISNIGVFPDLSCPRIVWAGITQGSDQLQSVFSQLEPNLQRLGFTPDTRGFSPHLTIARIRSARGKSQLVDFVQKNSQVDFGEIKAQTLLLKRSELTPQGPIYSTLKEYSPQ